MSDKDECTPFMCVFLCIVFPGMVAYSIIYLIILHENNIPEIRMACTSNLYNIMLVNFVCYLVGYTFSINYARLHDVKWGTIFLFSSVFITILATIKISHAAENKNNSICLDAVSIRYPDQTTLAGHASLETLSYFSAALDIVILVCLLVFKVETENLFDWITTQGQ